MDKYWVKIQKRLPNRKLRVVEKVVPRKQVILSAYFTTKKDPQRGCFVPEDKFNKIQGWYGSICDLGLSGVIFYDNLSDKFISNYENDYVRFVKYKLRTERSVNDERFYCWNEYLLGNLDIDDTYLTDLFDVRFVRDPFSVVDGKYRIYCGDHGGGMNGWIFRQMRRAYGRTFHEDKMRLNCGAIGGSRNDILRLLGAMLVDFDKVNNSNCVDMAVFNKCVYDLFYGGILHGKPVAGRFRGRDRGIYCIKHK